MTDGRADDRPPVRLEAEARRAWCGELLLDLTPKTFAILLVEAFLTGLDPGDGVRVGRGQCIEQYGTGEVYLPVLEALARLAREPRGDAIVRTFQAIRADLARAAAGSAHRRGAHGGAAESTRHDA
jgi:hypothetical protein